MKNKAQISMEFLMTYGWALLIILVAIAAISYYGVTNPEKFIPESCTMPTGIMCLAHRVQTTETLLVLRNNMGEDITISAIAMAGCTTETFTTYLLNGAKANFTIDACTNGVVGKKYKSTITITYTDEEGIAHQKAGELVSRVESSTSE